MSDKFINQSIKLLKKYNATFVGYSRIDGKPLFKINIDQIHLLNKYLFIELVPFLEDNLNALSFNSQSTQHISVECLLKASDFTDEYKLRLERKQKLEKICQKYL